MSDGKLQYQVKLDVDASQADILKQKLQQLSAEQELVNKVSVRSQGVDSTFNLGKTRNLSTVLKGFSQGGAEGGLAAIAKVAPRLQGSLIGVLGSLYLLQMTFKVGWAAGTKIMDMTIGKLDRMAEASGKAARAIWDGIRNAQKVSFEQAVARIETKNAAVEVDSGYNKNVLSRYSREEQAQRRLAKERGQTNETPSTSDVDQAGEELRAQNEKLENIREDFEKQKEVATTTEATALSRIASGSDSSGDYAKAARLQNERVATLEKTLAAEERKQNDLEAELQSAQRIAAIDAETIKAAQANNAAKASKKAGEAKQDYETSRKSPSQVLDDLLKETESLKAKFENAAPGVDRSNLESEYWAKLKQAMDLKDSVSKQQTASTPTLTDSYARIGGYLGGPGGSGIDYNRRTATATEKSVALLADIKSEIKPAGEAVALWG